ncbi:hypothetical protein F5B21DRAFT_210248 [Xylaria acuta]|nr:hypothetical protein F5B21DRAFT_210248 [Xylaria acuta]
MRVRHTTTAVITRFTIDNSSRTGTTAGITRFASGTSSSSSTTTTTTSRTQQQQQRQPRTAAPATTTTTATPLPPSQRRPLDIRAMSTSPSASPSPSPSASASASASAPASESEQPKKKLPPLSAAEFREYNRLAEHMDMFHAHFRSTWETLYTSASGGRRARGLSIRAFINVGLDFVSHLETHHAIEERYVFPDLARRMPEFRTGKERDLLPPPSPSSSSSSEKEEEGGKKKKKKKKGEETAAELLRQHVEIHHGMDGLRAYLRACLSGETELQMSALKAQLDTWGAVLWTHLDQEVKTLGAENMRRYWSLDEMRKMRM